MRTVPEAQARVDEWEREHGLPSGAAWAAYRERTGWRRRRRITREQAEDGAGRLLDLRAAQRRERRQRELANAERGEADVAEWIDHLRRTEP